MNEKRWIKNVSNLIAVNSIFAATAGVLFVLVLQDSLLSKSWYLPLPFLFSFFIFSWTAERITDAIDKNNTEKHVAYMLPYNLAVILLFFGTCFIFLYKYELSFVSFLIYLPILLLFWLVYRFTFLLLRILVILLFIGICFILFYRHSSLGEFLAAGIIWVASSPWLADTWWLIFSNENEFNQYIGELDGTIEPIPDPHKWEHFFYWLRNRGKLRLPHYDVYVRLKKSTIHGIGVFAIRDIPEGTKIFSNDESEMVWVDEANIRNIDPELRKLYDDFCVVKSDKYGCPKNFNMLTVGWYLNESKENPNVRCTDDYDFIALRDIKNGEELTVDYSTYSESPNK